MIIFDLDGTLWDTSDATLEAANQIAKENPKVREFDKETITKCMGLNIDDNARGYMPYLKLDEALFYLDLINKRCKNVINKDNVKLYPFVKETIINLSKKYKLGIVTNNNTDYALQFLDISGLKEYFTAYVGALSLESSKGFAIRKLMDEAKEKVNIYVGDINNDLISSKEAGAAFIWAKYGFGKDLKSEYWINNFAELEKVVEEINEKENYHRSI